MSWRRATARSLWEAGASRLLAPIDARWRAADEALSAADDGTRFPESHWDVRTLIAVFPAGSPFHFLNLNLLLGPTGVAFDRPDRLNGLRGEHAFDLQLCLEGEQGVTSYKRTHPLSELRYEQGSVALEMQGRGNEPHLTLEGGWPRYEIHCVQPSEELALTLVFEAKPRLQWWVRLPKLYSHCSLFGTLTMRWTLADRNGTLEVPALLDHGWGRNVLPLRAPLNRFRYEVLHLPNGVQGASLNAEGPFGAPLRTSGALHWDHDDKLSFECFHHRTAASEAFENYAGVPCQVPLSWSGSMRCAAGRFDYQAERATPARPLLGDGFLYGFEYQGRWHSNPRAPRRALTPPIAELGLFTDRGYAEQMGSAWHLGG
ncbi:MAG: hypothetical protein AUK47_22435 [Deltaproteobacteria bacterium CG2_30_63_29]|nr:MAG: hypothetical protein AUK47_22435 [Deltaproteobacteria bacterium CG2_30_63_29]